MAATAEDYANKEGTKKVEIAVPLKHLSNFWKTLDIPLINCEVSLALSRSANFVITSLEKRLVTAAQGDNPPVYDDSPTNVTVKITDCKLYVPIVTLSAKNDNKLLEQLKTAFKKQSNGINIYQKCLIRLKITDPTFTNVNRLFVSSLENENDRTSFSKYYVPKVEIKDLNVLFDGTSFFKIPVKNKEEAYEQIIKMSNNNGYTTVNLLDYEYFSKHCRLIVKDLSKQTESESLDLKQQINFIIEKKEKTIFDFSQNSVVVL